MCTMLFEKKNTYEYCITKESQFQIKVQIEFCLFFDKNIALCLRNICGKNKWKHPKSKLKYSPVLQNDNVFSNMHQ